LEIFDIKCDILKKGKKWYAMDINNNNKKKKKKKKENSNWIYCVIHLLADLPA
jgi:hypothetical protein